MSEPRIELVKIMAEEGFYRAIGQAALEEQRRQQKLYEDATRADQDRRVSSAKDGHTWWQTRMLPEIAQAQIELRNNDIEIETVIDSLNTAAQTGQFKAAVTLKRHGRRFYPYIFSIEDGEVSVFVDYSTSNHLGMASGPPEKRNDLSGQTSDPDYPQSVLLKIVSPALK